MFLALMFPSLNNTMIKFVFKKFPYIWYCLSFSGKYHGSEKKKIKYEEKTAIENINQKVKENPQNQRKLNDHKWRISTLSRKTTPGPQKF